MTFEPCRRAWRERRSWSLGVLKLAPRSLERLVVEPLQPEDRFHLDDRTARMQQRRSECQVQEQIVAHAPMVAPAVVQRRLDGHPALLDQRHSASRRGMPPLSVVRRALSRSEAVKAQRKAPGCRRSCPAVARQATPRVKSRSAVGASPVPSSFEAMFRVALPGIVELVVLVRASPARKRASYRAADTRPRCRDFSRDQRLRDEVRQILHRL